jgi:hypothetical protein
VYLAVRMWVAHNNSWLVPFSHPDPCGASIMKSHDTNNTCIFSCRITRNGEMCCSYFIIEVVHEGRGYVVPTIVHAQLASIPDAIDQSSNIPCLYSLSRFPRGDVCFYDPPTFLASSWSFLISSFVLFPLSLRSALTYVYALASIPYQIPM